MQINLSAIVVDVVTLWEMSISHNHHDRIRMKHHDDAFVCGAKGGKIDLDLKN